MTSRDFTDHAAAPLLSRGEFLRGAAGLLALGAGVVARVPSAGARSLPHPATSGIEHVVVVMMENRSFDHYLGWLPGADGRQAGLAYLDAAGVAHATSPLAPDYRGCGRADPDHSYEGGRIQYDNGACDGWLRAGAGDPYAIGYYTQQDLAFLGRAAPHWTTCDRYFAAIMAETYPNRFYQHAAQTDRIRNSLQISVLPTIWDRLAERGVSRRYYFSDIPFLALWGGKYLRISRPFATFLRDCARGTLPHVSFVEPRLLGEDRGISNDDHPHADVRDGEVFLSRVYRAITRSPAWASTVMVITYDEWGGFFDHVPPPAAPIPPADQRAGNADGLRGFRVPCVIISPFARRRTVSHEVFDHTSVLRLIEWRWGLRPLTVRDATATNLAEALVFHRRNLVAPPYAVPRRPVSASFSAPCTPLGEPDKWAAVRTLARRHGWRV